MTRVPGPRSPAALKHVLSAFNASIPEGLSLLQDSYYPICSIGFGPFRWVFLFGPEANELVLSNPDNFRFAGGYEILRPIAGDTALVVTDGDDHTRRREAILSSFSQKRVRAYTAVMLDRLDATISSWAPGQRLDVYSEIREAVRRATIETFAGQQLASASGSILPQLDIVHESMNRSLLTSLLTWNLQALVGRRAKAALAAIDVEIYRDIARRRREQDLGEDLISDMLRAERDDGVVFADAEIRDMLVSLLIASYDPVSSALGWAVYSMLSTPGVWAKARQEVQSAYGQDPVPAAGLRRLAYLPMVVSETLRLYPAVVASPRQAAADFEFAGHRIKGGTHVMVSQYATQHSPALWPEAESFRPERWDRSADGYRAPTPYEYFPFGSGPRRCLGGGLAATCVPAILARLLQRTTLEVDPGRPQLTGIAALAPRNGIWATVRTVDSTVPDHDPQVMSR
jgi:cytochrome P450